LSHDVISKYEDMYKTYVNNALEFGVPSVFENGTLRPASRQIIGTATFMGCVQEVCLNNTPIDQAVSNYATKMEQYLSCHHPPRLSVTQSRSSGFFHSFESGHEP
jgi:hypothetical protein